MILDVVFRYFEHLRLCHGLPGLLEKESSVYNSSWPEIRLLLSGGGGGGGGLGGGVAGGGSSADSASTLLTSLIVYVVRAVRNVGALDVLRAPTINGGTGETAPQQTNRNSLIILYLICSYVKRSLLNNSHY